MRHMLRDMIFTTGRMLTELGRGLFRQHALFLTAFSPEVTIQER